MLTNKMFSYLTDAAEYFNKHIFDSSLPEAMITLSRRNGAFGYFYPQAFNQNGIMIDEIALTPSSLQRKTLESLSTLLHEQCHQWQQHYGKPGKNGFHNKQWANKMVKVGLNPYSIVDGNKQTGYKCSHTINEQGLFKEVAEKFISFRGELPLSGSLVTLKQTIKVNQRPKLICPSCKSTLSIPKKLNIQVTCLECSEVMETED